MIMTNSQRIIPDRVNQMNGGHMKKVIVIGAGTAGLACAVRLLAAGYAVDIYEKNAIPGGKMHQIRKDGYTFDVGPTLVMMPSVYEDVFRAAGRDPADYLSMQPLDPMYTVYFDRPDHARYDVSSNLTTLMQMLEARSSQTASGFLHYLADIYDRYLVAVDHFITRPFRSRKDFYNLKTLRQALKLKTFDSADHMMSRYLADRDVRQMLSFQTLYIGVSPQKGPSLYNIIPMIELMYGVWFLKGGMYSMAQAMTRLITEQGGRLHLQAEVEQIVIENGRAAGVQVGGEFIPADYVVSNADFPYTMTQLIRDPAAKGRYTDDKINRMDYSCSCLIFYWGMDRQYPAVETHTFIVSADLDDNLTRIFDGRQMDDASIYLSIPSRSDPDLAPEGKDAFYVLIPVSELSTARYPYDEAAIAHYREGALRKIERLPGCEKIREQIVSESIMTPKDFEAKFSAYNGATFGLQPTLRQSNHWRPQAKASHCEGLYFTGSSTHPGAGVPIVLQSGKICAEELRRDNPEDAFDG